jgi:hypothetical protein
MGGEVRFHGAAFVIAMVHEHSPAAGRLPGLHVPPPVSYHEAGAKIDIPPLGGVRQKSGLGLAASAIVRIVMRTNEYIAEIFRENTGIPPPVSGSVVQTPGSCLN